VATFEVYGPHEIPYENARRGRRLFYSELWNQSEEHQWLCEERGVYVFCVRAGRGITPLYVGAATRCFGQECFNASNRHKYLDGLADYARGTPVMFFIVHPTQRGRTNVREILDMEDFFVQILLAKNPNLLNKRGTSGPSWAVAGVVGATPGKPSRSASQFKKAIGW
jgi:hypothetical protein